MKIVYAYICGDILHEGHLLHLENAKALGDKLIVGVLTDKAVMEKKPRPIIPFQERLRLISSLKCVDCAVPQDDYSPIPNIKAIQPDIMMESTSHIGNPYLKELRKAFKGRIVMMPYYPEQSSTAIKNKIKGIE
jgi:cytidyltransferase-like protein